MEKEMNDNTTSVGRSLEMSSENSSQLSEKVGSAVVLSFGRLNPPTTGHQKLSDKIKSVAKSKRADAHLYMSHSQDKKKNPLSYDDKVRFAKKAFGPIVKKSKARTIMQVLAELDGQYDSVYVVVGSDRVSEFEKLVKKYNGQDYNFDVLEVISAGERDPDAEGVEGMSASKLRGLAVEGDFESFRKGVPSKLSERDAKKMYDTIRSNMGINEEVELDEVLDIKQRRDRARTMRRIKGKIRMGQKLARRKRANPEKLKKRAQRQAKEVIRKKVAGKLGQNYKDLAVSTKIAVDKRVEKKKAAISRLAKRLIPQVRKKEAQRFSGKKESIDYSDVYSLVEQVHFENIPTVVENNLIKKSERYGIPLNTVKEMYVESSELCEDEQKAFNRLNSLLANYQVATINEAIEYHLEESIPFSECVFRMESVNYSKFFQKARKLYEEGKIAVDEVDAEILCTDIGEFGLYEGVEVPLDLPLLDEEEKKELNKPMRGGPKKFYVFVKDPSTGNVKKVTFGDTSGLKVKLNDPQARKSFAARHKCSQQTDKTKPAYWSCRLPRYAKQLGLSGGGNFFW